MKNKIAYMFGLTLIFSSYQNPTFANDPKLHEKVYGLEDREKDLKQKLGTMWAQIQHLEKNLREMNENFDAKVAFKVNQMKDTSPGLLPTNLNSITAKNIEDERLPTGYYAVRENESTGVFPNSIKSGKIHVINLYDSFIKQYFYPSDDSDEVFYRSFSTNHGNKWSNWKKILTSTNNSIPYGTVVAFAGETVPEGWLLCDGQWIWKHDYPELFNALMPFYYESNTHFKLPDYRGLFLRGVSGKRCDAYADPDCFNRTSCLKNGSNWVGSVQMDDFKSHTHDVITPKIHRDNQPHPGNLHFFAVLKGEDKYQKSRLTGGSETRPKNAYVHYIIYSGKRVADR